MSNVPDSRSWETLYRWSANFFYTVDFFSYAHNEEYSQLIIFLFKLSPIIENGTVLFGCLHLIF